MKADNCSLPPAPHNSLLSQTPSFGMCIDCAGIHCSLRLWLAVLAGGLAWTVVLYPEMGVPKGRGREGGWERPLARWHSEPAKKEEPLGNWLDGSAAQVWPVERGPGSSRRVCIESKVWKAWLRPPVWPRWASAPTDHPTPLPFLNFCAYSILSSTESPEAKSCPLHLRNCPHVLFSFSTASSPHPGTITSAAKSVATASLQVCSLPPLHPPIWSVPWSQGDLSTVGQPKTLALLLKDLKTKSKCLTGLQRSGMVLGPCLPVQPPTSLPSPLT